MAQNLASFEASADLVILASSRRGASFSDDGRSCNLCNGREFRLLHQWPVGDRWNPATIPIGIWQCQCSLVFLHPVPTACQLPGGGDWWSPVHKVYRRNRFFKEHYGRLRYGLFGSPLYRFVESTTRAISSGRFLDVGCGDGEILSLAARYYDCVGIEPSPIAAETAQARGFSVIEAKFEDGDIEAHSFDVVAMYSVIEHVLDPLQALRRVNRILRQDGVVALQTPKFGGLAYHIHGSRWNGFRHGYHTYLFTGQTLGRMLEMSGFEVLRYPKRDRWLDDVLILWGRKVREVAPEIAEPTCHAGSPPAY